MKNECNIIRDLLPLYMDGIISEDTISFVEEHLKTCEDCRAELEKMKAQNALENTASVAQVSVEKPLKVFAKKMNRKKRIIITSFVAILLIVTLLGGCFLSYLKFQTPNLFSAASGFVQVTLAGKEYVEIQQSPRVIIAQPGDALFVAYMESRGFTEVQEERLGARRVFSNGEEKEAIFYSQNGYFSKWIWEKDENSLLSDLGITKDAINYILVMNNQGQEVKITNRHDYSFLFGYTYREEFPGDRLHELFLFPNARTLTICYGTDRMTIITLLEDGSIVTGDAEDSPYKLYSSGNFEETDVKAFLEAID